MIPTFPGIHLNTKQTNMAALEADVAEHTSPSTSDSYVDVEEEMEEEEEDDPSSPTTDEDESSNVGGYVQRRFRVGNACIQCKKDHTACEPQRPCSRCLSKGVLCLSSEHKKRGRKPKPTQDSLNFNVPNPIRISLATNSSTPQSSSSPLPPPPPANLISSFRRLPQALNQRVGPPLPPGLPAPTTAIRNDQPNFLYESGGTASATIKEKASVRTGEKENHADSSSFKRFKTNPGTFHIARNLV